MSSVASPPSSTMSCGPLLPGCVSAASVKSQYSSSVSPLCAKTGVPAFATAAAAWSCVEKMLQLAQRTDAPSSTSVSMRTAVSIVMCSEPETRTPFSGFCGPYFSRQAMRPGISCSATEISLRPQSARDRSRTAKSLKVFCGLSLVDFLPLVLVSVGIEKLRFCDLHADLRDRRRAPDGDRIDDHAVALRWASHG